MATSRKTTRKKTLSHRERRVKSASKIGMVVTNGGLFTTTQIKPLLLGMGATAVAITGAAFFVAWLALTLVEVKEQ